ncbi:putative porin [Maribacter sp.]|nr:putative porin [Maribacter sp.]
MRYFLLVLFLCSCCAASAQEKNPPLAKKIDSAAGQSSDEKPLAKGDLFGSTKNVDSITIRDYKIISFERDTTYLDTTLTIQKEYKYNYLRKDDFELMPFANVGQPYNKLGLDFRRKEVYPRMGARAKHFNYEEVWDINYYNVPTPMSDMFFKTTFEQGQLLDARLTFNTSRRLNFSISYKGHRSLGKYRIDQARSGNFRATTNYETKNGRYNMRAHTAAQSISTEENGGLALKEVQFESGEEQFRDRSRIDVRFTDADNKLIGKRYFLDHQFKLLRKLKDSSRIEKTSFAIGHRFNYETKIYDYSQTAPDEFYGDSFLSPIDDRARLKTMFNQANLTLRSSFLGRLQANINLYNYNYYFNSILTLRDGSQIGNQLKGEEVSVGANYEKTIKGFDIEGAAQYNISGDLTGTIIDASAGYRINDKNSFRVAIHSSNRMPNYNFLLYQSDYENYNWQNTANFEKESVNSLQFGFDSKLFGKLSANYSAIDNYTYFAPNTDTATQEQIDAGLLNAFIKPAQETNSLKHLKVKYNKEFRLGKFALNNTVMYQNVEQTNQVLNLPQLVTRNTLYFSSDVFKKAMYLQTGITFKYFTDYTMDAYNPVLGEFYVQNNEKLGGYPLLDFFINARVQQTRIYLKAEHFNSFFSKNNFYAAPDYPYRDFVIRFGLVWNFFS